MVEAELSAAEGLTAATGGRVPPIVGVSLIKVTRVKESFYDQTQ